MLVFNNILIGFRRSGGHFSPRLENATLQIFSAVTVICVFLLLIESIMFGDRRALRAGFKAFLETPARVPSAKNNPVKIKSGLTLQAWR
jgi:hypothetical protein